MIQFYLSEFFDLIDDHLLRSFIVAALIVWALSVWIAPKIERAWRFVSKKRRECETLERWHRLPSR